MTATGVPADLAELVELRRARDEVLALHVADIHPWLTNEERDSPYRLCRGCGYTFPCATVRAFGGAR